MDFTWYGECLFNLKEDPYELNNLVDDPRYKEKADELRNRLHHLVDTEAITLRAFEHQDKMLKRLTTDLSETDLTKLLEDRLGKGQAKYLVKKLKTGMLS
jgi:hypothetical protein